ncbi:hypothetical protein RQP46_003214 [Phenoliferia psychrophenolica]
MTIAPTPSLKHSLPPPTLPPKRPRPTRSSNPLQIKPLGNLLFRPSNRFTRISGLGALGALPDELLLSHVFGQLEGEDLKTQGRLLDWHGSWRSSYIATFLRPSSIPSSTPLPTSTITTPTHHSDVLFQPSLCASFDPLPLFLSPSFHPSIPRLSGLNLTPSTLPTTPVILTNLMDTWEDLFEVMGDERPDYRWLIVGPTRSGSTWHQDPNGTSAWNAVTVGSKAWIMFSPDVTPPGVFVSADQGEVEAPLSLAEWFATYYKGAKAMYGAKAQDPALRGKMLEGICNAGEIFFVPSGWWHIVINLAPSIAVTQNFVSHRELPTVLRFMRDRPEQVSGFKLKRSEGEEAGGLDDCDECVSGVFEKFYRSRQTRDVDVDVDVVRGGRELHQISHCIGIALSLIGRNLQTFIIESDSYSLDILESCMDTFPILTSLRSFSFHGCGAPVTAKLRPSLDAFPSPATLTHLSIGTTYFSSLDHISTLLDHPTLSLLTKVDLPYLPSSTPAKDARYVAAMAKACEDRGIRLSMRGREV